MENLTFLTKEALLGNITASEVYVSLLSEQEQIEESIKALKSLVIDELNKYSEKEVKLHGLTFQKKTAPGKWDFSNIPSWNTAKGKIKSLEEMAKQKYKAAEKGQDMFLADENGEEIPTPIYISGAETFAVLKK